MTGNDTTQKTQTTTSIDIMEHQGLARTLVNKYVMACGMHGYTEEDLMQTANIGLLLAANKYDPEKGAFSTYASLWIRHELNRLFYTNSSSNERKLKTREILFSDATATNEEGEEVNPFDNLMCTGDEEDYEAIWVSQVVKKAKLKGGNKHIFTLVFKYGPTEGGKKWIEKTGKTRQSFQQRLKKLRKKMKISYLNFTNYRTHKEGFLRGERKTISSTGIKGITEVTVRGKRMWNVQVYDKKTKKLNPLGRRVKFDDAKALLDAYNNGTLKKKVRKYPKNIGYDKSKGKYFYRFIYKGGTYMSGIFTCQIDAEAALRIKKAEVMGKQYATAA